MDISENTLAGMNDGEKQLYYVCKKYESDDFKIIPNAIYKRAEGGTNQIDLLAVSIKGIFVFEMKDYKGWIFGNEDHREWTQVLSATTKKVQKNKFRNPVKQNDNHIKTIKKMLSENNYNIPVYNVVVFGWNAELKDIITSVDVVNLEHVGNVIEKYPDVVIAAEVITEIHEMLTKNNVDSELARAEHLKYAKDINEKNIGNKKNAYSSDYKKNTSHSEQRYKQQTKSVNSGTFTDKPYSFKYVLIIVLLMLISIPVFEFNFFTILGIIVTVTAATRLRSNSMNKWIVVIGTMYFASIIIGTLIVGGVNLLTNVPNNYEQTSTQYKKSISEAEIQKVESPKTSELKNGANISILESQPEEIQNNQQADSGKELISNNESSEVKETDLIQEKIYLLWIGSSKSEVKEAMGEPTSESENKWNWNSAYITFDENEKISGWYNYNNILSLALRSKAASAEPIYIGSNKEMVIKVLGAPTFINDKDSTKWNWGSAYITFGNDEMVSGWYNYNNTLNDGLIKIRNYEEKIKIGSSMQDVISILGAPTFINADKSNQWNWGSAYVTFDSNGKVSGWYNYINTLSMGLQKADVGAKTINIGSTKTDVLSALGGPTFINESDPNKWNWGSAYITFDNNESISGWYNYNSLLSDVLAQSVANAPPFFLGSTKDEVTKAVGSPMLISDIKPNTWSWDGSNITFDNDNKVSGWYSQTGAFNKGLVQAKDITKSINIGSTKDEVLVALGAPTIILERNPKEWYWNSSIIKFDSNYKVASWYDPLGLFNVNTN